MAATAIERGDSPRLAPAKAIAKEFRPRLARALLEATARGVPLGALAGLVLAPEIHRRVNVLSTVFEMDGAHAGHFVTFAPRELVRDVLVVLHQRELGAYVLAPCPEGRVRLAICYVEPVGRQRLAESYAVFTVDAMLEWVF